MTFGDRGVAISILTAGRPRAHHIDLHVPRRTDFAARVAGVLETQSATRRVVSDVYQTGIEAAEARCDEDRRVATLGRDPMDVSRGSATTVGGAVCSLG